MTVLLVLLVRTTGCHSGASMVNLSRYIHARGLKLGIYNSNSMTTCMSKAGGLYHERLDAATYAGWGVECVRRPICNSATLLAPVLYSSVAASVWL